MSKDIKLLSSEEQAAFVIATLILFGLFVGLGWWAFSWSTHTLVWLAFMGFTLESFGQNALIKRTKSKAK